MQRENFARDLIVSLLFHSTWIIFFRRYANTPYSFMSLDTKQKKPHELLVISTKGIGRSGKFSAKAVLTSISFRFACRTTTVGLGYAPTSVPSEILTVKKCRWPECTNRCPVRQQSRSHTQSWVSEKQLWLKHCSLFFFLVAPHSWRSPFCFADLPAASAGSAEGSAEPCSHFELRAHQPLFPFRELWMHYAGPALHLQMHFISFPFSVFAGRKCHQNSGGKKDATVC